MSSRNMHYAQPEHSSFQQLCKSCIFTKTDGSVSLNGSGSLKQSGNYFSSFPPLVSRLSRYVRSLYR